MSSIIAVQKGDRFTWGPVCIEVTRVDRDGRWADVSCHQPSLMGGSSWAKRQPLPFPETFIRVESDDGPDR